MLTSIMAVEGRLDTIVRVLFGVVACPFA